MSEAGLGRLNDRTIARSSCRSRIHGIMSGIQDRGRGYKTSAWLLGSSIGVARSEEWIYFFAASSGGAFSRDSITGTVIVHEGPAAFDRRRGGVIRSRMDHGPTSPNRLTRTFRFNELISWTIVGEGIQPRVPMTFRHRGQEIVAITMSARGSSPTQDEQAAEQDD